MVTNYDKAAKLHAYDLLNCPVSWDATRLDGSSRGIQHTIFGRDHELCSSLHGTSRLPSCCALHRCRDKIPFVDPYLKKISCRANWVDYTLPSQL